MPAERLQDATFPRYGITVVTDLTGIPAQQLRRYEEAGLLKPHRTPGGTRQYTDADVVRLLEIGRLTEEGVNMPGIRRILSLRAQLAEARVPRAKRAKEVSQKEKSRKERAEGKRSPSTRHREASQPSHSSSTDSPAEDE